MNSGLFIRSHSPRTTDSNSGVGAWPGAGGGGRCGCRCGWCGCARVTCRDGRTGTRIGGCRMARISCLQPHILLRGSGHRGCHRRFHGDHFVTRLALRRTRPCWRLAASSLWTSFRKRDCRVGPVPPLGLCWGRGAGGICRTAHLTAGTHTFVVGGDGALDISRATNRP